MRFSRFLIVGILIVFLVATGFLITQYLKKTTIEQKYLHLAISPDGKWLAWVQQGENPNNFELSDKSIYLQELVEGSYPKLIATNGKLMKADDSLSWSPNSKQFAFFSDESSQPQLYIGNIDGTKRKITNLNGFLSKNQWSPDGKSIALLYVEGATRTPSAGYAGSRQTGVIDEIKIERQLLTVIDVGTGEANKISPSEMYVYEYAWSPDSNSFALTAARDAGDASWWVARLYTIAIENKKFHELYKPQYQIAFPKWSPDGNHIAFIDGLMSDEISVGGEIYLISARDGKVVNLTPDIPYTAERFYWVNPQTIIFAAYSDGLNTLSSLDIPTRKIVSLLSQSDPFFSGFYIPGISLSENGRNSATIQESYIKQQEIWVGPIGQWKQLTRHNDSIHRNYGEMKSIHWMNGSLKLQGWLLYPVGYDPNQCYPMIVLIHGGPAWSQRLNWIWHNFYDFSLKGYFVFYPNPRGSFGLGETFTRANIKDFGTGDFRDIMTGIDVVLETLPVNKDNLGIMGWSYGGYMTMWAVTQTHRFRAAVSGAGISNWQSYYGQNKISEWLIPYFGASLYDDPAIYLQKSPITFIKNVKTPTLIISAELDEESPAAQSLEFWRALKTLGVETQLVIYGDEGHWIQKPENIKDLRERTINWFEKYLKPVDQNCKKTPP